MKAAYVQTNFRFVTLFLRESRSSDLNQLVFGVGFDDTSLLRWLDTCDILELFCDGMRLGIGLAFGVDRRRLVAISMACVAGDGSNVSTSYSFDDISDLLEGGDDDFFRTNNSFICKIKMKRGIQRKTAENLILLLYLS